MKIVFKLLITVIILLGASGCSVISTATGHDYDSADMHLRFSSSTFATKERVIMQEGKSYVVYINAIRAKHGIYEEINDKLKIVGYVDDAPSMAIIEVEPGEHTFVNSASCSAYTITIDVEKGNAYYFKTQKTTKRSLMQYCRSQHIYKFIPFTRPNVTKSYFDNYVLVPENIELANEMIENSSLPGKYRTYKEDIDELRETLKLVVESQEGSII